MRPYYIEINWVDFNATVEDDIYEIIVWDKHKTSVVTTWTTSGCNVGLTISKYMHKDGYYEVCS